MTQYSNKGRFGLWLNKDRKEATHPHLSGKGEELNGNAVWVSAWFANDLNDDDKRALQGIISRHSENSKKPFFNVSLKAKQAAQPTDYEKQMGAGPDLPKNGEAPTGGGFDDIPFAQRDWRT